MRRFIRTFVLACACLPVATPALAQDDKKASSPVTDIIVNTGLYMLFHHRAKPCRVLQDGWIEPSQGVWQDDDFFPDRKGAELIANDARSYTAELPMVVNRDTLLYGILRPAHQSALDRRNTIAIRGETFYSKPVAVKVRISVKQNNDAERRIFESKDTYQINLDGPCSNASQPFDITVDASKGVPAGAPFTFTKPGTYTIRAELISPGGGATGLYTSVTGKIVTTQGPLVHVLPLYSERTGTVDRVVALGEAARTIAHGMAKYGPMYFPIAPDGLPTVARQPFGVDATLARWDGPNGAQIRSDLVAAGVTDMGGARRSLIVAELVSQFQITANLGGLGRFVLLFDEADVGGVHKPSALANAETTKVIFAHPGSNLDALFHEIGHTENPYLWSSPQMQLQCSYDYHNNNNPTPPGSATQIRGMIAGGSIIGLASGARTQHVLENPAFGEERTDADGTRFLGSSTWNGQVPSLPSMNAGTDAPLIGPIIKKYYEIMGAQPSGTITIPHRWITQCTYANLVTALHGPQDPPDSTSPALLATGRSRIWAGSRRSIRATASSTRSPAPWGRRGRCKRWTATVRFLPSTRSRRPSKPSTATRRERSLPSDSPSPTTPRLRRCKFADPRASTAASLEAPHPRR